VQRAAGVARPADQLALRRSALRVAPDGPLTGRVLAARTTPEVVRLRLDVDGVGEVDAVADLPVAGGAVPGLGTAVPLVADLTRTAPLFDSEVSGGWS
jgi:thiamine transport system ATP-binding protein